MVNAAVLSQRIARVHRLGQTDTVQTILMVATQGYEGQVLNLVKGKSQLFNHVIEEEASEDVVGVSKKLLETLMENLSDMEQGVSVTEVKEAIAHEVELNDDAPLEDVCTSGIGEGLDNEKDNQLQDLIVGLQQTFSGKIERILGAGGGLLVVVRQLDADMDDKAKSLGGDIPVALIDPLTLQSLNRLGDASPITDSKMLYDKDVSIEEEKESWLLVQAKEKLNAAKLLLGKASADIALELVLSALLNAAAVRLNEEQTPTHQEVTIWLYDKAIPTGVISQSDAGLIMKAVALGQSVDVPEEMVRALWDEVDEFLG